LVFSFGGFGFPLVLSIFASRVCVHTWFFPSVFLSFFLRGIRLSFGFFLSRVTRTRSHVVFVLRFSLFFPFSRHAFPSDFFWHFSFSIIYEAKIEKFYQSHVLNLRPSTKQES
jgi:hypothetical protein